MRASDARLLSAAVAPVRVYGERGEDGEHAVAAVRTVDGDLSRIYVSSACPTELCSTSCGSTAKTGKPGHQWRRW